MSIGPVELLSTEAPETAGLVALLRDAVAGGASIGFLSGLTAGEATQYWQKVIADMRAGSRSIWIARDAISGSIVGSVQLAFESRHNGRHRAEVQKLLVLQAWRRQRVGSALLAALEEAARPRGITVLFLDTSDGPGGARRFYEAIGYAYVGGIPGFALDPDGTQAKNAIYYKSLAAAAQVATAAG